MEKDLFAAWNRRQKGVRMDLAPRDGIREATRGVLPDEYRLGADETIVVGYREWGTAKTKPRIIQDAKPVEGLAAITCQYTSERFGSQGWMCVSRVHVLVKGRDVVVVGE